MTLTTRLTALLAVALLCAVLTSAQGRNRRINITSNAAETDSASTPSSSANDALDITLDGAANDDNGDDETATDISLVPDDGDDEDITVDDDDDDDAFADDTDDDENDDDDDDDEEDDGLLGHHRRGGRGRHHRGGRGRHGRHGRHHRRRCHHPRIPFLRNTTRAQKKAFFAILRDRNATKDQLKERTLNWAANISDSKKTEVQNFITKVETIRSKWEQNVTDIISQLGPLFQQFKSVIEDGSLTPRDSVKKLIQLFKSNKQSGRALFAVFLSQLPHHRRRHPHQQGGGPQGDGPQGMFGPQSAMRGGNRFGPGNRWAPGARRGATMMRQQFGGGNDQQGFGGGRGGNGGSGDFGGDKMGGSRFGPFAGNWFGADKGFGGQRGGKFGGPQDDFKAGGGDWQWKKLQYGFGGNQQQKWFDDGNNANFGGDESDAFGGFGASPFHDFTQNF